MLNYKSTPKGDYKSVKPKSYDIGTIANSYNRKTQNNYNSKTQNYSASIGTLLGAYLASNSSKPEYSKMIGNYINNLISTYTSGKTTKERQKFDLGMMIGLYAGSKIKEQAKTSEKPYISNLGFNVPPLNKLSKPYKEQIINYGITEKEKLKKNYLTDSCEICGKITKGENICQDCIKTIQEKDSIKKYK